MSSQKLQPGHFRAPVGDWRLLANEAAAERLTADHISEAIQFRSLDRQIWG